MEKMSIKTVVAIGIGAALFFVIGRFLAIPSGIPNLNFTVQYGILALFAILFGPIAGGLVALIGHTLIDLSWGGAPWWSWIIASTVVGITIGIVSSKMKIEEGSFGKKEMGIYVLACLAANILAWLVVAPGLDILMYAEPAAKVFTQGIGGAIINFIASTVVGGILLLAYAKTKIKKGSLSKE